MPKRRTLSPYYKSTFIEVLTRMRTADDQGVPDGLDKQGALRFLECICRAADRMKRAVAERPDDAPVEGSSELLDRLEKAMRNGRKDKDDADA